MAEWLELDLIHVSVVDKLVRHVSLQAHTSVSNSQRRTLSDAAPPVRSNSKPHTSLSNTAPLHRVNGQSLTQRQTTSLGCCEGFGQASGEN